MGRFLIASIPSSQNPPWHIHPLGFLAYSPHALTHLYLYHLSFSISIPYLGVQTSKEVMNSAHQGALNTFQDSSVPENQGPTSLNLLNSSSSPSCNNVPLSHFCPIFYQNDQIPKREGFSCSVFMCTYSFLTSKTIPSLLGFFAFCFLFFKVKFCWQISPSSLN